jgi:hypothetical protein
MQGSSNATIYASESRITNSGNGLHIGSRIVLSGSGTGTKYGVFSSIASGAGGTHYGIYSDAQGSGNYSGYFRGNFYMNDGLASFVSTTDASGTAGSGVLEIGGSMRFDPNEIITNTNLPLLLQWDNNGDLQVDQNTFMVDASVDNVGVRTSSPDYPLSVSGTLNLNEDIASGVALRVNGAEALWYNGTYFSYGFGGIGNYFADNVGIANTAPNAELDVIGDIEYTGTITDVSDRRLKENFKPIDHPLARLRKITGFSYNMKDDPKMKREYGVIAQDVQEVFPEMVSVVDVENGYLGVSYIQLVPVLLEALKEQQIEIETLKNQLKKQNQLEDRLTKIEARLNFQNTSTEISKNK